MKSLEVKNQGQDTDKCLFYAIASMFEIEDRVIYNPDGTYEAYKVNNPGFGADFKKVAKFCCKYGFEALGVRIVRKYRKPVFIDKSTDIYESIVGILNKEKPVLVGAKWKPEWNFYKDGIIQSSNNEGTFYHAFFALDEQDGYLICQSSNGTNVGDNGLFKFPKEVVNKDFHNLIAYFEIQEPWYIRFARYVFTKN